MAGASSTVSVKLWVAVEPMPLEAEMLTWYTPPLEATGVPDSTPVTGSSDTPPGRVPVSLNVGAGKPEAVAVKLPAVPTVKVVEAAEVTAGAWSTVRVKLWLSSGGYPVARGQRDQGGAARTGRRGARQHPVDGSRVTPFGSAPDSPKVTAVG